ncbi:MAG: endopeptidase La [Tenuifilaceae bacterium]|jgi:ATP-dependent Lon protease|nr:endopeptidase La [Bacteroidales bacterium]MDI9517490.1 endopeptidase La [Bacteroidota bacterium]NLH57664.1 endopeptidase La [Rikenellaceae bacterium]OQC64364.1 MAG: Lon protease 2 [Bacteroidetes bacterium ADurb.Bin008]HOF91218.1 endopeptidase La [Tenuifilaceae bacterium]
MSDKSNKAIITPFLFDSDEREVEVVTLFTEDEGDFPAKQVPSTLPILALRNTVLFPGVVLPITVGREKSTRLIKSLAKNKRILGAVSQVNAKIEEPEIKDLFTLGTVARVLKVLEMPDGSTSVILQGLHRFQVNEFLTSEPFFTASVTVLSDDPTNQKDREFKALIGSIKDFALKVISLSPNMPQEAGFAIKNIDNNYFLINFICSNIELPATDKQQLLEKNDLKSRSVLLLEFLAREIQLLEIKNDIQNKVRSDMSQQQREYFLHQQMKTIQDELGGNPVEQGIEEFKEQASKKKWSKEVAAIFDRELTKLSRMNPMAADFSVQHNYVQFIVDLPWNEYTKDSFNLKKAEKILDEDHFGLEQVKERILEHLAVLKLKGDMKAPILCLHGPPGVGKTSLGKSVARALNRKYARISLGGLHDEAEIRGHRRTYIGAMPGRIIQNIKKVKASNPVFILDEIDKVGKDFHGDPASALLEVLDPEQNSTFHDNYLDIEFDLSRVLFITTANNISSINPALRDRMEMIEVSGYIMEEKVEIAKRHLIPQQIANHGLKKNQLTIPAEVLEEIIRGYTRESGVRTLNQRIAKVVRNVAKKIAFGEEHPAVVSIDDIRKVLGVPKYLKDTYLDNELAGVATGLAWTETGGEILFIETSLSKGKGTLTITGNLGEVMKESAIIAQQYIKANCDTLKLNPDLFGQWDVHLHVPEGAIPKDGPSAGITMVTSLASAYTQRKVRKGIAMTGEITLRGKVLPVGGIKEKILAAKRAGVSEIILSKDNEKDVSEIREVYIKGVKFKYVEYIGEVLDYALLNTKVKSAKVIA